MAKSVYTCEIETMKIVRSQNVGKLVGSPEKSYEVMISIVQVINFDA